MDEIAAKLELMRAALDEAGIAALRLRGSDWFAWATAGASNSVLLAAETGVAELLITADDAWILTDTVELERFAAEVAVPGFALWAAPWQTPKERDAFVAEQAASVASDRPANDEQALPAPLLAAKRRLLPAELVRYRRLGAMAAAAFTEVLLAAKPEWTELELAAAAAAALWSRGIEPALVLAGNAERTERFGHTPPTSARIGPRAMLVACGRAQGLYANLTRFVCFGPEAAPSSETWGLLAEIEARAWRASVPGATLGAVYATLSAAYKELGFAGAEHRLHQGGTTGYLSREVIARRDEATRIEPNTALAWNPSVPGLKLEDTIVVTETGLEVLTIDSAWPAALVDGYPRPLPLVR